MNGIISNEVKRKLNLFKKLSFSDYQNEKDDKDDKESNVLKMTKSIVQGNIKGIKKETIEKKRKKKEEVETLWMKIRTKKKVKMKNWLKEKKKSRKEAKMN
jgi:transcription initiation factor IIE alpha subunit